MVNAPRLRTRKCEERRGCVTIRLYKLVTGSDHPDSKGSRVCNCVRYDSTRFNAILASE